MHCFKMVVEFDGTNFVGWQTQPNGRSVQEEITKVLEQVLQEPISVIGSGRTDSGVHARGMVAGFQTNSSMRAGEIMSSLNGILPEDIYVHSVEEVAEKFHARYDARDRMYRYYITLRPIAIGRFYQWHVRYPLRVSAMSEVAALIVGDHDFTSFSKYDEATKNYRCIVTESFWEETPSTLVYQIRANRFAYGMVRGLVGTMIDVGRGFTPVSEFSEILKSCDRRRAGMAAPPQGLFLEEVRY
ncbi:MAG TPA: tRNA pseudouridine(38-40) synthase TruA [Bacteroidota bacterium]|nr:tRNA pseudouridine(38-40) synthase TruA [Bacteroidota bacterium]